MTKFSNDRLKRYNVNREKFNERLPRIKVTERSRDNANPCLQDVAKPLDIVREHKNKNKRQYTVKYDDGKTYLCEQDIERSFRTKTEYASEASKT